MPEPTVPISAIEHYSYCVRQCALIHVERVFEENAYTVRGRLAHERIDREEGSWEGGVRVARGLPLWSERYGLSGKGDIVELRPAGPYPIEYKLGRRRGPHADLQLCAQALCLEEMFDTKVERGALFHRASGRRAEVAIDGSLRQRTVEMVEAIRTMIADGLLPAPRNDRRCPNCSLVEVCMPRVVGEPHRLRGIQGAVFLPLGTPSDA